MLLRCALRRRKCRVNAAVFGRNDASTGFERSLLVDGSVANYNGRSMSTLLDVCGLPVVTSSWPAVKSLDQAYMEYANLIGDPYRRTEEALKHDPSCVMAHCLRGLLAALTLSDPLAVEASLGAAERDLVEQGGVSGPEAARERVFAATLRAWSAGRWREGALRLETWLMTFPTDLPALKLTQDAHITAGDGANSRDCIGRVLPFWSRANFGYSNVLGMHAFGLAENRQYAQSEERAESALALQPKDVWAANALAHVYDMEARASEGCSFLNNSRDQWDESMGPLRAHMAWHLGLFSLERGQERRAQGVFDTLLGPPREGGQLDGTIRLPPPLPFALSAASNLLWRMDLLGVETGELRWRGVAEAWLQYDHARHLSTLHDVHALMAFAAMANGVEDTAEADLWNARAEVLLQSMRDYVRDRGVRTPQRIGGETTVATTIALEDGSPFEPADVVRLHSCPLGRSSGETRDGEPQSASAAAALPPDNLWVAEHLGISLCEAMAAYRKGDFESVVSKLLPLRYHLGALGGSQAKHDLVHVTLLDAASRLPDSAIARTLVCERTSLRPTSGRAWEAYGALMDREGKAREAFEAQKMAFQYGIGQGGVGAN